MLFLVGSININDDHITVPSTKREIEKQIKELELPYYRRDNLFFISFDGTTSELSEKIGLGNDEKVGFGVVIRVVNYAGYAHTDLWEWMKRYE